MGILPSLSLLFVFALAAQAQDLLEPLPSCTVRYVEVTMRRLTLTDMHSKTAPFNSSRNYHAPRLTNSVFVQTLKR